MKKKLIMTLNDVFKNCLKAITVMIDVCIAIAALIVVIVNIQNAIEHPMLKDGIVVAKSYYDGHPYTTSWNFGQYTLIKTHSSQSEVYQICVQKNDHRDWWDVSKEQYYCIEIGSYIEK